MFFSLSKLEPRPIITLFNIYPPDLLFSDFKDTKHSEITSDSTHLLAGTMLAEVFKYCRAEYLKLGIGYATIKIYLCGRFLKK